MRLKKAIRYVCKKLKRYNPHNYYGIDLGRRCWCWVSVDKTTYQGEITPDPMITDEVIRRLMAHPNYIVMVFGFVKVLINRYTVVKRPSSKYLFWLSRNKKPIVQKCNSKRRIQRRKTADKIERQAKRNREGEDKFGINSISNTAFGHPKRMKAFSLKEKTEKRNEQSYKERNIPPLSND